jgi:hypothetical protein
MHADMIIEELWRDEPCRRSILKLAAGAASASDAGAGPSAPTSDSAASASSDAAAAAAVSAASAQAFREYIKCILNSLIYLFKVRRRGACAWGKWGEWVRQRD